MDSQLITHLENAIDHWLNNGMMTTRTHLVLLVPASMTIPEYLIVRRKRIRVIRRDDILDLPHEDGFHTDIYLMRRRDYTRHWVH